MVNDVQRGGEDNDDGGGGSVGCGGTPVSVSATNYKKL